MRARVNVYGLSTGRGPAARPYIQIEDAEEIGFSAYANDAGECYFTLPVGHAAQEILLPLRMHLEIQRQASVGSAWTTLWRGLLEDMEPGPNETTYYGTDYLSLLATSLTAKGTKYTNKPISDILQTEMLSAIRQGNTTVASGTKGVYAKPGTTQLDGTYNQQAGGSITITDDGTITRLGGWFRGNVNPTDFALCVWDVATGDLLASTSKFTATGARNLYANVLRWEGDLAAPLAVTAGQTIRFGWACDPAKSAIFTVSTGTHLHKDVTGTWPGSMASATWVTGAIGAYAYFTPTAAGGNSRLGFVTIGTIEASAASATITSEYQSRLDFLQSILMVEQQGSTTRPIMSVSLSSPHTFDFAANAGSDKRGVNLEYGGLIDSYRSLAGYGNLATKVKAVGQKASGSTVLFSEQGVLSESTYGIIERAALFSLVPDQAGMDKMTLYEAQRSAQLWRNLAVALRSGGLVPFDGWSLMDSVPLTIVNGPLSLDKSLYTIWGVEWIGHRNGSESTSPLIMPKLA